MSALLVGCLARASEAGAILVVEHSGSDQSAVDLVRHLVAHRVDGVILPPPLCDDGALLKALAASKLPMVQVATGMPSPLAYSVSIDDFEAAREMTAHLIANGHRRIGFISGGANQTASARRQAGYEAALRRAGIAADASLVVAGDFSYRSGLEAAGTLLRLPDRPTAIFASNDDMAAAVVSTAHQLGLPVPGEISVCGFDDSAMACNTWPELTTMRQPIGEMARAATSLVIEAVRAGWSEHPALIKHLRQKSELIRRNSDAPRSLA